MKQKVIDCMMQHIKTFREQAVDEVVADFGEPCQTCPHIENCSYDWLSEMEPLLKQSAIQISMVCQGHSNKLGNDDKHPGQDMGIHRRRDMNKHPSYNREPLNQASGFQNN